MTTAPSVDCSTLKNCSLKHLSIAILGISLASASYAQQATAPQPLPVIKIENTPTSQPTNLNPKKIDDIEGGVVSIEQTRRIVTDASNTDIEILPRNNAPLKNSSKSTPESTSVYVDPVDIGDMSENTQLESTVINEIDEQAQSDALEGQAIEGTMPADSDAMQSMNQLEQEKSTIKAGASTYAKMVNDAVWSPNMKKNHAMTVKLQTLLDWNHASPGPIDGGWGMNSKKALANFQTMNDIKPTGTMNQATWDALIRNINPNEPVLVEYVLTQEDLDTPLATTPSGSEAKSKMKGLYYQSIKEMLAEKFHMDIRYLEKLNKNKEFAVGKPINVINTSHSLNQRITRVIADKDAETLYAYNGNKLIATYPTTVGSSSTPSPHGTFKIVNKVRLPWYKATVEEGEDKKVYMLPPGPNNPVGAVWMGLSKPSYGLHGSPIPEGISRQASHGCIRLTNWDALEVYYNIEQGATVELK